MEFSKFKGLVLDRPVTFPNFLSLSRLIILPFVILFLVTHKEIIALSLMGLAWVTDVLDGFLARKWNQVSNLGKIIDPLTDKLFVGTVAIVLFFTRGLPLWIVLFIIGRDAAIVFGSPFFINRFADIPSSNLIGKITGFSFAVLLTVYTLGLKKFYTPVLYAVVLLIFLSALSYALRFFKKR